MKFKKPNFWDYKKPNLISYLFLPITFLVELLNFLKKIKKQNKPKKIKTICVGNIYIGGTGKTPISIKIHQILKDINIKSAFIKKKYSDQFDEQKLLSSKGKLYCDKKRIDSVNKAINDKFDIVIFDDGLQDKHISYDLSFVCFNTKNWIGNGLVFPSGPLRENLNSLKKYYAIFLNGNNEANLSIQDTIKKINPKLKIFEGEYFPLNIDKLDMDKNYLVFSGIGSPDSFINTLKKYKFKIVKNLEFPDHYNYSDLEIMSIKKTAKIYNADIITTEKDYIRLSKLNSQDINFLEIELKIKNEKKLIDFLNTRI